MYKKIKKQISFIAMYKIIIFILNYILIAFLIDYLGQENFGIYIALTSLFSWMFLFDLGIAKGMRNFVTLALANKDSKKAKKYISTAYIAIFFLTIFAFFLINYFLSFINLKSFLSIPLDDNNLHNIFFILLIGFFLKFYLSIVDQLNYATHKSQNVSLNRLLVVAFNFIGISLLFKFQYPNEIIYTIFIFSISVVLPYLYSTIHFFYLNSTLLPSFSFYSKKALKDILNKGSKILFIQIGFLCIIGLDRLILLKYSTPIEVFRYEIIYKVMSIIIFPISIMLEPLWSSFSEAYILNDLKWIKDIFQKFYIILFASIWVMLILVYFFDNITNIWIKETIDIGIQPLLLVGCLILFIVIGNFYSSFLLGNNKLLFMNIIVIIGLISKVVVLYFIQIIDLNTIVISSLVGYGAFIIFAPFYIKNLLKVKE